MFEEKLFFQMKAILKCMDADLNMYDKVLENPSIPFIFNRTKTPSKENVSGVASLLMGLIGVARGGPGGPAPPPIKYHERQKVMTT